MQYPIQEFRRSRPAFTLVEILAVIFIIALLSVLILGAVHRARRSAAIAKTRADFAAISSALEQYHSDFKVYPGLIDPPMKRTILAQALIGPGPATEDGEDGPGFRTVINPVTGTADPNAKKWDAYLSPERFKVQKFTRASNPGESYWALLDQFGNPIRYYPKRKALNAKIPGTLADKPPGTTPSACIFDARDGENPQTGAVDFTADSLQVILGDVNNSNCIDGDENLTVEGNFILMSPGPDELFTIYTKGEAQAIRRQKSTKSDDIFNFER